MNYPQVINILGITFWISCFSGIFPHTVFHIFVIIRWKDRIQDVGDKSFFLIIYSGQQFPHRIVCGHVDNFVLDGTVFSVYN